MTKVATEVGATTNRYQILAKLAVGGMAEIFLARGAGGAGVARYCVLKRILREFADDAQFMQMFLDEARLAAQLQHPNIASVYDLGMLGDSYFFTMEYVHGETVRSILSRAQRLRRPVPLACVLTIIAGTAAGLHHAHDRVSSEGRPLGIVHRDVTPSNLMVSYEGNVKIVDFGVAKAADRAVETRSGIVKGKISYLSPEQCRGARVDRRSDLFSLGIVMWEMLTGARLYRRDSDFENMTAIVHEPPPRPSSRRHDVPSAVDDIVMRLLAKSVTDRFQSAADVVEAIENASARAGTILSTSAVSRLVRDLFGTRAEPWLELDADTLRSRSITLDAGPPPGQPVQSGSDSVELELAGVPELDTSRSVDDTEDTHDAEPRDAASQPETDRDASPLAAPPGAADRSPHAPARSLAPPQPTRALRVAPAAAPPQPAAMTLRSLPPPPGAGLRVQSLPAVHISAAAAAAQSSRAAVPLPVTPTPPAHAAPAIAGPAHLPGRGTQLEVGSAPLPRRFTAPPPAVSARPPGAAAWPPPPETLPGAPASRGSGPIRARRGTAPPEAAGAPASTAGPTVIERPAAREPAGSKPRGPASPPASAQPPARSSRASLATTIPRLRHDKAPRSIWRLVAFCVLASCIGAAAIWLWMRSEAAGLPVDSGAVEPAVEPARANAAIAAALHDEPAGSGSLAAPDPREPAGPAAEEIATAAGTAPPSSTRARRLPPAPLVAASSDAAPPLPAGTRGGEPASPPAGRAPAVPAVGSSSSPSDPPASSSVLKVLTGLFHRGEFAATVRLCTETMMVSEIANVCVMAACEVHAFAKAESWLVLVPQGTQAGLKVWCDQRRSDAAGAQGEGDGSAAGSGSGSGGGTAGH